MTMRYRYLIETLRSPALYSVPQMKRCLLIVAALDRGTFTLCEPPELHTPADPNPHP